MSHFERKPIFLDEESVAELLRRARQHAGLQLSQVAKKLNISQRYLDALEKGHYDKLPSGVYSRNFLREYALFLGLDDRQLIDRFEIELQARLRPETRIFGRRVLSWRHLIALPHLLRNAIIGVLIIACLGYLAFLLQRIFDPPFLAVDYPPDNYVTASPQLTIKGESEPETDIRINGQAVPADKQGVFSRDIYLQPGLNTISVTSEKKYSRTATVVKQVLVQ